jgi:hypothetical protein
MYTEYQLNNKNIQNKKMLLVEQDAGFISPDESRNQPFINELKKLDSGKLVIIEPLVVYVILQKYGVLNRNGRVYPESVLKKQVELYQKNIKERTAIGECVPAGTEIFTTTGWKNIEDVNVNDEIFTMNVNTNKLEKQFVLNTIKKPYNDDMIHIYNNSTLDMMITKKHKVVLWDRNNKPYILTGEELYQKIQDNDSTVSHSYIKNSAIWDGDNSEYFTIPNSNIKIKTKDWAAFLGLFIAKGHTSGSKGGCEKNLVCITQKKERTKKLVIDVLNKLPFKYTISDNRQINIYDKELFNHLRILGNSNTKFIPDYAKNWSVDLLTELLDWMLVGDGKNRKNRKGEIIKEYITVSNRLKDDVFEVMLKIGNGGSYSTIIPKDRYIFDEKIIEKEVDCGDGLELIKESVKVKRLIKAENSKPLHIIHQKTTKGISLDLRFIKSELAPFNDDVYCVTVPNNTWLMRYNGKIAWTHNCDHPESSIIAADRISHNILETWWEGKTLMGKMEILMSPGFINYGIVSTKGDEIANLLRNRIKIGVSSRGVGSLKEGKNGEQIVQDDFEIICWDVVTAPSTPDAWIFRDLSQAKPYVESITPKISTITENIKDKLDDFLL